jgi:hypothetical protein
MGLVELESLGVIINVKRETSWTFQKQMEPAECVIIKSPAGLRSIKVLENALNKFNFALKWRFVDVPSQEAPTYAFECFAVD